MKIEKNTSCFFFWHLILETHVEEAMGVDCYQIRVKKTIFKYHTFVFKGTSVD